MMFTATSPLLQEGRIRLYFSHDEARAAAGSGGPVYGVAVHYDGLLHRLLPLETGSIDATWSAPAWFQEEGFVIAPTPIPRPLFLGRDGMQGPSDRVPRAV